MERHSIRNSIVALLLFFEAAASTLAADFGISAQERGGGYAIVYYNQTRAPLQIIVNLDAAQNVATNTQFPLNAVLQPSTRGDLAFLLPANTAAGMSFTYTYRSFFGNPGAYPDSKARYRLPFANGMTLQVGQAPDSEPVTHTDAESRFAVDIPMPVNTRIVAARGGWVVQNIRPHGDGKLEPAFREKSNYVMIMHPDGTWAIYAHLLHYSANIVAGQWIDAGVEIGLSGTSGFSSGPHLHFVIQRNTGGAYASIPFRFYNVKRGEFSPKSGDLVTADYAPARGSSGKRRPLKECMGPDNVVTDAVVACTEGRSR